MSWLGRFWRENRGAIVVIALLVIGYVALRSNPTDIASADTFLASLSDGHVTIVSFYSNF